MDSPSIQLQGDLNESIQKALSSQRPVLTHLNADTSWLVQLPYPANEPVPRGRSRWNIIFDPWFQGPQSDVASFFSTQWHTTDSCVQTMAELDQRLQEIEANLQCIDGECAEGKHSEILSVSETSYIDAVVISHEFTDHCNKRTLLELAKDTPIFATKRAVNLIRSWKHFDFVQEIPTFSTKGFDWRKASFNPLPPWLGISQVVSHGDALDYHSAILLTFDVNQIGVLEPCGVQIPAEGIIYTPHGIHAQDLKHLPSAVPPVKTLALLHGLHDIQFSRQKLNLGAHNGLQAQRLCRAKYWVSTHDEIKKATGLITPWLYRNPLTLREALEEEMRVEGKIKEGNGFVDLRGVTFADLLSGESLLLV